MNKPKYMYVDPNKTAEELTPEEETYLIKVALWKISEKHKKDNE